MLKTYEGYLEKGRFYPSKPMTDFSGRYRVIVVIIDEKREIHEETPHAKALREFYEAVDACDEEIPEAFDRVNIARGLDL